MVFVKLSFYLISSFDSKCFLFIHNNLMNTQEESGALRMKPRDPRRVLHSSGLQTGGSMEIDQPQLKTTTLRTPVLIGNMNGQRQDRLGDKISAPLPSTSIPDITLPFTENLKNLADILSVSQTSSQPTLPQASSSQPTQTSQGRVDAKGVLDSGSMQTRSALVSKEVSAVSSRSHNNWDDVEHLFDGFDEQQKAAIQKERARRLEEQRKMFAARKLCLVLDLDHTLLNSAKVTISVHSFMLFDISAVIISSILLPSVF